MRASSIRHRLLALSVCAAAATAAAAGDQRARAFEYQQVHMGLPVRILLHASDQTRADDAAQHAFERIAALERIMSDYRPDSELRRLEDAAGRWTPVTRELLDVLATAVTLGENTDGAFDPTVGPLVALWRQARRAGQLPDPAALRAARKLVGWRYLQIDRKTSAVRLEKPGMRLDLGGIAKGYILQQALQSIQRQGIESALVESGGDIVVGAAPPGRTGWHIQSSAEDPAFRQRAATLAHAALATSGSTEQFVEIENVRYSHLVDPRTGEAVIQRVAAQVIARDAATADGLATAAAIVGEKGLERLRASFPRAAFTLSVGDTGDPNSVRRLP